MSFDYSLEKFPSFFKGILSEKLVAGRIPFFLNKGNLLSLQKRDFSLQTPGYALQGQVTWCEPQAPHLHTLSIFL